MIPGRFSPLPCALAVIFLTCVVSGLLTLLLTGIVAGFLVLWFRNWMLAWMFTVPTAVLVSPLARQIVARVTRR